MLLVTGCNKTPDPEININGSPAISLAEDASNGSFTFTANRDWTVDSQDSWIHVSPASGSASDQSVTVTFTCDPNPNATPRSTKVIIKAGGITKEITVTQAASIIPVTGISISPSEATLTVGETLQLTATVTPENASDKTVVWSRDLVIDDAPFEITTDGLVTATSAGECNATATCGGITANCLITVVPEPNLLAGTLYSEDFERANCMDGWTLIDADGDGYGWMPGVQKMGSGYGHNGSYDVLLSQSYDSAIGSLHPDNWAFTPAITLAASNNNLSLWLCAQDASFASEHIAVYITEQVHAEGDIASKCTILMEGTFGSEFAIYTKVQSDWLQYQIPIPAEFNGKTVYFGFRHFKSTDMFYINLDDIVVTGGIE